jgi:hypothetical protein
MPYRSPQIFGNLDQAQVFYQHAIDALEGPELQQEKLATGGRGSPIKSHSTQSLGLSHIPRLQRSTTSLREGVIDEERLGTRMKTPSRKAMARAQLVLSGGGPASPTKTTEMFMPPTSPEVKIRTPKKVSSFAYLSTIPQNYTNNPDDVEDSTNSCTRTIVPATLTSRTRIANFNDDLDAFASMVCEHAASVARFRHKVLTKQAEEHGPAPFRPAGRFQSAGGPSKSRMGWDEMVERIDRLRARKWEMPRFEAERYQGLCERAMEDLES